MPWATHALQWPAQWVAKSQDEANPINAGLSSDWRLQLASMKSESLVIAGQPYRGEYVLGPCTHRPSHHESRECLKRSFEHHGRFDDWGEVVTRYPYRKVRMDHLLSREDCSGQPEPILRSIPGVRAGPKSRVPSPCCQGIIPQAPGLGFWVHIWIHFPRQGAKNARRCSGRGSPRK
jgi:hypothetical protein